MARGKGIGRKLESVQERVGRKLMKASDVVAGMPVHGKLRCRESWKCIHNSIIVNLTTFELYFLN